MSMLDGFYDLIDFVGSLGDEIGNILVSGASPFSGKHLFFRSFNFPRSWYNRVASHITDEE